jgi:hypothetical protein
VSRKEKASEHRRLLPFWLLGQMSASVVLWDIVAVAIPRVAKGRMRITPFPTSDRPHAGQVLEYPLLTPAAPVQAGNPGNRLQTL